MQYGQFLELKKFPLRTKIAFTWVAQHPLLYLAIVYTVGCIELFFQKKVSRMLKKVSKGSKHIQTKFSQYEIRFK